jgi:hypothetical protein
MCGFDDFDIAEALDRFEVTPILSDNSCFPPASTNCEEGVERHSLRITWLQFWELSSATFPSLLSQPVKHFARKHPVILFGPIKVLSSPYV